VLAGSTCVGVGISGLTLGGGIGHATRALGVLADSVLGATVVLANGTVVEADSKSNPDLFWVSQWTNRAGGTKVCSIVEVATYFNLLHSMWYKQM
jgi:hypothetical protein